MIAFDYSIKPFFLQYRKISRFSLSFFDEVKNTALHIANSTDKPIMIAMSGGIDSEVAARGFIENNIPIRALIVRFNKDLNTHDIKYAKSFCEKYKVSYQYVDLNFEDFFVNFKFQKYIDEGYKSTNIFRYLQLFLLETIENLGYTAVLGGGEQIYSIHNDELSIKFEESFLNSILWCKNNNKIHFPYFFQTTPEIIASYLTDDLIKFMLKHKEYYGNSPAHNSTEKIIVYHKHFKDMNKRNKFNGFENVQGKRKDIQKKLNNMFPDIQTYFLSVKNLKNSLGIV